MTLCERCRKPMVMVQEILVDFGEGDEDLDFEACLSCRILYVAGNDWTVRQG